MAFEKGFWICIVFVKTLYGQCTLSECISPCDASSLGFGNAIYNEIDGCPFEGSFGYQLFNDNSFSNYNYYNNISFPFYIGPSSDLTLHCVTVLNNDIININRIRDWLNGNELWSTAINHESIFIIDNINTEWVYYSHKIEYIFDNNCILGGIANIYKHALIWEFGGSGNGALYQTCNNVNNMDSIGYGKTTGNCNTPADVSDINNAQYLFTFNYLQSYSPTITPTKSITSNPTEFPSISPNPTPTQSPSISPTKSPSITPTETPTLTPTESPSLSPTIMPTNDPSISPVFYPSISSNKPTNSPIDVTVINVPQTMRTKSGILLIYIIAAGLLCIICCLIGIFAYYVGAQARIKNELRTERLKTVQMQNELDRVKTLSYIGTNNESPSILPTTGTQLVQISSQSIEVEGNVTTPNSNNTHEPDMHIISSNIPQHDTNSEYNDPDINSDYDMRNINELIDTPKYDDNGLYGENNESSHDDSIYGNNNQTTQGYQ